MRILVLDIFLGVVGFIDRGVRSRFLFKVLLLRVFIGGFWEYLFLFFLSFIFRGLVDGLSRVMDWGRELEG